jgi:hypothetical protein
VVKEITITSTAPASKPPPTSTRITVATPRAQPSANGVSQSTIGSSWLISAMISPVKITEVIAGGIAPSRKSRGRRVMSLSPLANSPTPMINSATAAPTSRTRCRGPAHSSARLRLWTPRPAEADLES